MSAYFFQLTTEEAINAIAERVLQLLAVQNNPPKALEPSESPISMDEACQELRISRPTMLKRMKEGKVVFHRQGRRVYFFRSELLESLRQPKSFYRHRR